MTVGIFLNHEHQESSLVLPDPAVICGNWEPVDINYKTLYQQDEYTARTVDLRSAACDFAEQRPEM